MSEPTAHTTDRIPAKAAKMDPTLKERWLVALRSGRYKQGRGALRDENECFCCIGVLADVVDPTRWSSKAFEQTDSSCAAYYDYCGTVEMVGFNLQYDWGIKAVAADLASMNDGDEEDGYGAKSFAEIADYIEANL